MSSFRTCDTPTLLGAALKQIQDDPLSTVASREFALYSAKIAEIGTLHDLDAELDSISDRAKVMRLKDHTDHELDKQLCKKKEMLKLKLPEYAKAHESIKIVLFAKRYRQLEALSNESMKPLSATAPYASQGNGPWLPQALSNQRESGAKGLPQHPSHTLEATQHADGSSLGPSVRTRNPHASQQAGSGSIAAIPKGQADGPDRKCKICKQELSASMIRVEVGLGPVCATCIAKQQLEQHNLLTASRNSQKGMKDPSVSPCRTTRGRPSGSSAPEAGQGQQAVSALVAKRQKQPPMFGANLFYNGKGLAPITSTASAAASSERFASEFKQVQGQAQRSAGRGARQPVSHQAHLTRRAGNGRQPGSIGATGTIMNTNDVPGDGQTRHHEPIDLASTSDEEETERGGPEAQGNHRSTAGDAGPSAAPPGAAVAGAAAAADSTHRRRRSSRLRSISYNQKLSLQLEGLRCSFPPGGGKHSVQIVAEDLARLEPCEFLNDTCIDFYIKHIESELPEEKRKRYHFFNSFFLKKLQEDEPRSQKLGKNGADTRARSEYERVKRWTKHVDLFDKDYIFVPSHGYLHWSLVLVCHPGAIVERDEYSPPGGTGAKRAGRPLMLHLDSLDGSHAPEAIFNYIRRYLTQEWRRKVEEAETNPNTQPALWAARFKSAGQDPPSVNFNRQALPGVRMTARLPKQDNHTDCGLFLLSYMEFFTAGNPRLVIVEGSGGAKDVHPIELNSEGADEATFFQRGWFNKRNVANLRGYMRYLICKLMRDAFATGQADEKRRLLDQAIEAYEREPQGSPSRRYMNPKTYLAHVKAHPNEPEQPHFPEEIFNDDDDEEDVGPTEAPERMLMAASPASPRGHAVSDSEVVLASPVKRQRMDIADTNKCSVDGSMPRGDTVSPDVKIRDVVAGPTEAAGCQGGSGGPGNSTAVRSRGIIRISEDGPEKAQDLDASLGRDEHGLREGATATSGNGSDNEQVLPMETDEDARERGAAAGCVTKGHEEAASPALDICHSGSLEEVDDITSFRLEHRSKPSATALAPDQEGEASMVPPPCAGATGHPVACEDAAGDIVALGSQSPGDDPIPKRRQARGSRAGVRQPQHGALLRHGQQQSFDLSCKGTFGALPLPRRHEEQQTTNITKQLPDATQLQDSIGAASSAADIDKSEELPGLTQRHGNAQTCSREQGGNYERPSNVAVCHGKDTNLDLGGRARLQSLASFPATSVWKECRKRPLQMRGGPRLACQGSFTPVNNCTSVNCGTASSSCLNQGQRQSLPDAVASAVMDGPPLQDIGEGVQTDLASAATDRSPSTSKKPSVVPLGNQSQATTLPGLTKPTVNLQKQSRHIWYDDDGEVQAADGRPVSSAGKLPTSGTKVCSTQQPSPGPNQPSANETGSAIARLSGRAAGHSPRNRFLQSDGMYMHRSERQLAYRPHLPSGTSGRLETRILPPGAGPRPEVLYGCGQPQLGYQLPALHEQQQRGHGSPPHAIIEAENPALQAERHLTAHAGGSEQVARRSACAGCLGGGAGGGPHQPNPVILEPAGAGPSISEGMECTGASCYGVSKKAVAAALPCRDTAALPFAFQAGALRCPTRSSEGGRSLGGEQGCGMDNAGHAQHEEKGDRCRRFFAQPLPPSAQGAASEQRMPCTAPCQGFNGMGLSDGYLQPPSMEEVGLERQVSCHAGSESEARPEVLPSLGQMPGVRSEQSLSHEQLVANNGLEPVRRASSAPRSEHQNLPKSGDVLKRARGVKPSILKSSDAPAGNKGQTTAYDASVGHPLPVPEPLPRQQPCIIPPPTRSDDNMSTPSSTTSTGEDAAATYPAADSAKDGMCECKQPGAATGRGRLRKDASSLFERPECLGNRQHGDVKGSAHLIAERNPGSAQPEHSSPGTACDFIGQAVTSAANPTAELTEPHGRDRTVAGRGSAAADESIAGAAGTGPLGMTGTNVPHGAAVQNPAPAEVAEEASPDKHEAEFVNDSSDSEAADGPAVSDAGDFKPEVRGRPPRRRSDSSRVARQARRGQMQHVRDVLKQGSSRPFAGLSIPSAKVMSGPPRLQEQQAIESRPQQGSRELKQLKLTKAKYGKDEDGQAHTGRSSRSDGGARHTGKRQRRCSPGAGSAEQRRSERLRRSSAGARHEGNTALRGSLDVHTAEREPLEVDLISE